VLRARHDAGKRQQAAPQGFAQHQDVGRQEVLAGEHPAGSAEFGRYDDDLREAIQSMRSQAAEELADLLILILWHSLAMKIDLESEFHRKMDRIMQREARRGKLGIRVTEYTDE